MNRLLGALGYDPRWMEALSGATAILWSLVLLAGPTDLVAHPGYMPLARFAPDWVWVGIVGIGGLLQVAAARRNQIEARLVLAVAMGGVYLLLADGLRLGATWSPSVATYLGPALGNVCAMLLLTYLWLRKRAG